MNILNKDSNNVVLIMAGGLGKRMNSELPKVLHNVDNKPMIIHIIENAIKLEPYTILIVVGKYKNIIEKTINLYIDTKYQNCIQYILQETPNGTGHAIICSKKKLKTMRKKNVLILSGDTPLVDNLLMEKMLENLQNFKICTTCLENPYGYGRVMNFTNKNILSLNIQKYYTKIIEQKDCNEYSIQINHVNCGIYAFRINLLITYLYMLTNNNNQNEYYLTDLVEIITKREGIDVEILKIPNYENYKVFGINTNEQLVQVENILIKKKLSKNETSEICINKTSEVCNNQTCDVYDNFTMY